MKEITEKDIEEVKFAIDVNGKWYAHGTKSSIDVEGKNFNETIAKFTNAKRLVSKVI